MEQISAIMFSTNCNVNARCCAAGRENIGINRGFDCCFILIVVDRLSDPDPTEVTNQINF